MKLSKIAKAKFKMATQSDKKSVSASARKLFDYNCISRKRALAITKEANK
tara:strand:+ start:764 stop:913 length:150 start_codon:yes stop_codon:yes gene_type:complete